MAMISGERREANSIACLQTELQRSTGTTTIGGALWLAGAAGAMHLVVTLIM